MPYNMLLMLFAENLFHFKLEPAQVQHNTWQASALPRQTASQDYVERVLLLRFFQSFVLAEHEGYPCDFPGGTH